MKSLQAFPIWLAVVLLSGCSESSPSSSTMQTGSSPDLEVVVVEMAQVARETAFDGIIEAIDQSTVAAQTSGRVVELQFDVGDYVDKGAVIARLTDTEQSARVRAAESAVAGARARLAEAQLSYDRTREVFDKQLIARAQFDKVVADYDSAQARLRSEQAALDQAREGLDYTVIKAPYAGTVVARHVQVGETVVPGMDLMTGLSLENLRAVVEIPQQHIGPLRKHATARVILPGGQSVLAAELRIPPSASSETHSFRVLVTLPKGDFQVYPGTLVKVAFVNGEIQRLLVPGEAIVRRGELTGVYVVSGTDRISLRYLRTGTPTADDSIPVLAGLEPGERVAIDPIAAGIAYKNQARNTVGDEE
jgi:RND family efflux transporter MFP subunit